MEDAHLTQTHHVGELDFCIGLLQGDLPQMPEP